MGPIMSASYILGAAYNSFAKAMQSNELERSRARSKQ